MTESIASKRQQLTVEELIEMLKGFDGDLVVSFLEKKEFGDRITVNVTSLKVGYTVVDEEDGEAYLENPEGGIYTENDEGAEQRLILL